MIVWNAWMAPDLAVLDYCTATASQSGGEETPHDEALVVTKRMVLSAVLIPQLPQAQR